MADATQDAAQAPTDAPDKGAEQQETKTFNQEDVNRIVGERLMREREKLPNIDELKAKAERLDELEEAQRTETEKLANERDGLKEKLGPLETENLRLRVALDKNLPSQLIDRLKGGTKEEMETDADELMKLVGGREETTDFDGGARTTPAEKKTPEAAHNDFIQGLLQGGRPAN